MTDMADWRIRPDHARDDAEVRAFHEGNRAAWNQAARRYTDTLDDAVQFLRAGRSNLHPVERANLGDLRTWCRSAVHLQCASGKDTLSLWIEGVEQVVGIDISDVHIANARRLSERVGCSAARRYRCDVLDTPHELDVRADLVHSRRGATCWVHDISAWTAVVARLLRPGGRTTPPRRPPPAVAVRRGGRLSEGRGARRPSRRPVSLPRAASAGVHRWRAGSIPRRGSRDLAAPFSRAARSGRSLRPRLGQAGRRARCRRREAAGARP